ncbi:hypothetical protein [Methanobrevibacter sp.]
MNPDSYSVSSLKHSEEIQMYLLNLQGRYTWELIRESLENSAS